MKNDQKGCGCSSQVMVAVIGLLGVILTGVFGLAGALIGREDIPIPFLTQETPPTITSTLLNPPSQGSNAGNNNTIPPTSIPTQNSVRSHMVLDGFTSDNATGAIAGYRIEIDAEGITGGTRSTFTGLSTTTVQDGLGQLYYRQAYIAGEFNSGVLSLYDTGILSEDFLPSGALWCYLSIYAPAADAQGSAFIGTYESQTPPCFGQVNLQVISQTQMP
jgi:hypothetical protein